MPTERFLRFGMKAAKWLFCRPGVIIILKKVWLEKTAARKLTAKESRKLKAIYDGRKTDRTWIDMVCDERSCLYKNRIRIIKYGGLEIDGKDYDLSSALGSNFYIDGKKRDGENGSRSYRPEIVE